MPQGGLDIPCNLHFYGKKEDIAKIKKLLALIQPSSKSLPVEEQTEPPCKKLRVESAIKTESDHGSNGIDLPVRNVIDLENFPIEESSYETAIVGNEGDVSGFDYTTSRAPWVSLNCITLLEADKTTLTSGSELTDMHINFAQAILKTQFNNIRGFYSTLLLKRFKASFPCTGDVIQIMHTRGNHWIVVSTVGCSGKDVNVYDSLYSSVDSETIKIINVLFGNLCINMARCPQQTGMKDCGVFAIAIATALANGLSPNTILFDQTKMQHHLIECFKRLCLETFP